MILSPQRYKIIDQKGKPFIDILEIQGFLAISPTAGRVREVIAEAMAKCRLSLQQTAVLLNAPRQMREEVLEAASELKRRVYGNRMVLFAPLYVGNKCSNLCSYCSYAADNHLSVRKTLSPEELVAEVNALSQEGHKRLILVYGEHAHYSPEFIAGNVRTVYSTGKIRRVNINAAPLEVEGFREIAEAGIGTYQIFQESYNEEVYAAHHRGGKKADYNYRLTSLDRAMEGGVDDVGLGVLFGLNGSWREEVMGLVRHTNHLESCFGVGPHTISFPRMTPALGAEAAVAPISDDDFLYAIAVLRLAVPYAGLILTARESAEFRTRAMRYGVSQIDGGTKLEIGGYSAEEQERGGAQFSLTDSRTIGEIIEELIGEEFLPSFCTACYRKGRTGEHFMEFSTEGFIKRFCTPNALFTLAEYLEDYASEAVKEKGYALIDRELQKVKNRELLEAKIEEIKRGERDIFF